jgi:16S rRNA A1518/A1519 N6-dimethyltransferase RsmA/KsgA/DIM1 with predicted DNA glycosylase/AP lyase activity
VATERVRLADARVLEIGSGPGLPIEWLLPRCGWLSAVEIDADDAEHLSARPPAVEVRHADATDLPFAPGMFDIVVCFTMLHPVPTRAMPEQMLA